MHVTPQTIFILHEKWESEVSPHLVCSILHTKHMHTFVEGFADISVRLYILWTN